MRKRDLIRNKRITASTDLLDRETLDRYLGVYQCPFCQDGKTYRMLALHISKIHGINAYEFRKDYDMNRGHKLVSPETSEVMSQSGKAAMSKKSAFMKYDRRFSALHRYQDGRQRGETLEKKSRVGKENRAVFVERMSKYDRKENAKKIDPAIRRATGQKGARALWKNIDPARKKIRMEKLRSQRTEASEAIRIEHARETMVTKYWNDPEWRKNWRERVTQGRQAAAKVPRSEYQHIVGLFNGGLRQGELAVRYGVSRALISLIVCEVRRNGK